MTTVKILHNPRCSKSREALNLLRDHDIEPEIVEYLKSPLSETEIREVLSLLDKRPRDIIRRNESSYTSYHVHDMSLTDDDLIRLMHLHPSLIERPIVIVDKSGAKQAALGRPPETVLEII